VVRVREAVRRYTEVLPRGLPPWVYLAVAVVAVGWVRVASTTWVFLGSAACILAIACMGLTILVGWGGEVSLAQASLVGTSVYITGYALRADGLHWPFIPAAALGVATVVVLSALISVPTARLSGMYVMVLTLGLQVTLERTLFTNARFAGGVESVYTGRPRLFGLGFDSDRAYYFLPFLVLVVVIVSLRLFRHSRHGRALLMVGRDRRAAAAMGISPWRYKLLAFMIAGALAGVAGALTTPLYRSPPTSLAFISVQSLFYLAVPVTAGFGSLLGVVLVAVVFTMTPHSLESVVRISPLLLGGAGLMLGTYVGPGGFAGVLLDRVRAKREGVYLAADRPDHRSAARSAPEELDVRDSLTSTV
jgi:ABC-type branched-subunit amino acid transport system permease subunit